MRSMTRVLGLTRGHTILFLLAVGLAPLTTLRLYAIDEIQYFAHLRSAVFDRDLDFTNEYRWFVDRDPVEYDSLAKAFLSTRTPAGRPPNNAPIGSAVLWSALYVPTVALEALFGRGSSPPGYSRLDIAAVCVASMLFGVLGLWLTYEAGRDLASERAAFWGTAVVWLGSNLPFYMYVTPPMSHANSFFASALLLCVWLRSKGGPKSALLIGALGGLLASVRWQDALFLLTPLSAPLFAGAMRESGGVRRWLAHSFVLAFGFALAFLPQLIVWWRLNGSLTPYGLLTPSGEMPLHGRFSLGAPHLLGVLFSPFHGLFVWTPVLIPAFVGLALLAATDARGRAIAVGVVMQIYLLSGYVVAFGHGFGQRLFISSLPAAAIGLAVFVDRVVPRLPRAVATAGVVFAVWWNVSLMVQHGIGLIPRNAGVDLGTLVRNQVIEVPRRLPTVLERYLLRRESLYKVDPLRRPVQE
jgi:hypothetical protein